jgi:hypothetical protein
VVGRPIVKSQQPLYALSTITNGEKALATYTGRTTLTASDIETAEQLIVQRDENEVRGFYHKRTNTLFQSPTAACATLLNRPGASNSWRVGHHIWLERDGKWIKLMDILKGA